MNDPIPLTNTIPSVGNSIGRSPWRRGLPRKQPRKLSGPRTQATWTIRGFLLSALALVVTCFALSPQARAVCQQGCDLTLRKTFLGEEALNMNMTGGDNTAIGFEALFSNTTGSSNTADGSGALFNNTTGIVNTANGAFALFDNTTGNDNTATGYQALHDNTTGSNNTANGSAALASNTTGRNNTANGVSGLQKNTSGG
jgi:hypothetical protein